jgi:23S rRNA pseudouridine2605 synthase
VAADRVQVRKRSRRETHLVIRLREGRNREIRRLLASVGHEVTRLRRVALGGLELGSLPAGRWRPVSADALRAAFPGAPIPAGR